MAKGGGLHSTICPVVKEGKRIKLYSFDWKKKKRMDCNTHSIIYILNANLKKNII